MSKGKERATEPSKDTAALVSLISGGIAGGVEGESRRMRRSRIFARTPLSFAPSLSANSVNTVSYACTVARVVAHLYKQSQKLC